MNYEQKYLKYKQKYLQLKGGIMRCPFKPGDIVQVIGPFPLEGDVASTHLNLFGEVKGIKFFKLPKTDVEECIYIQIVIDKVQNEILKVRPNNLKRLENQDIGKTMFNLQNMTRDLIRITLQNLKISEIFMIYSLKNPYINTEAMTGPESIKLDYRNPDPTDSFFIVHPQFRQLFDNQRRIHPLFEELISLETLTVPNLLGTSLKNSLNGLINLKTLNFDYFNQSLGTSLQVLVNLENLNLGNHFNQPLGTSLQGLINLKALNTGSNFNQAFGNSLQGLINLQSLDLGPGFQKGLGTSLQSLTNLQNLVYYNNQPLGTSLNGLTNLKKLRIWGDLAPFGNSLQGLINLETLHLHNFNKRFENSYSLQGLTNLKTLEIWDGYDQYIGDKLNGLTNLETLIIRRYIETDFNPSVEELVEDLVRDLKNLNLKKIEINGSNYGINIRRFKHFRNRS
jgi:hypothetical protein